VRASLCHSPWARVRRVLVPRTSPCGNGS
jgi:hypothetical protein